MDSFTKAQFINTILEKLDVIQLPLTLGETLNKSYRPFNMQPDLQSLRWFLLKNNLAEISYTEDNIEKYRITEKGRKLLINNDIINLVLMQDFKESHPEIYDEEIWRQHYDEKIEKRADQADFFFDIIISERLLNLDKPEIRKYFKQWFWETQPFDLQIKNGDLAIEDGDLQIVPDFNQSHIPDFIKWFENKKASFLSYIKEQNIDIKKVTNETGRIINNSGSLIINEQTRISNHSIESAQSLPDSNWTKANVITAIVVAIFTIVGILWGIFKA